MNEMHLHHPWCNFFHRPRKGCHQCEGLFKSYPLDGQTSPQLVARYFPDAIPVNPSKKIPMNSYSVVAQKFRTLCERYKVSTTPSVGPAFASDPCDYTGLEEVRLNVEAAGDIDPDYHARHVFGHFLCGLHERDPDGVADLIAHLLAQGDPDDPSRSS
jgi:hypothetical protein